MARIPEAEIERLKSEVALERLVEASGVELKRHGADLVGRCPWHEDRTPSLVVSPAKNLWHCLGACQMGGSVIDWVMKVEGVSFRHAVELLREGVTVRGAPVKQGTVRKLPAPIAFDADDQLLLNQVIDYYHETLKTSPEAIRYLEARGLHDPEMVRGFKLGFANRTLGLRLPDKQRKSGAEVRARLERIGILRAASGHEHFNGSLVIPVIDAKENVTEVYGRKLADKLRARGSALHLYLPGPHKGVWNEEALEETKEVILCEALIDALTFWCAGFRNVTASYGVEGFTEDMLAAFKRHGTERVLIAYDRDAAGDAAAEKLAERLIAEGIDCYRIQFPKGMDANEYALKVQPASKSLGLAIRKSLWLGKGAAPERIASEEDALPVVLAAPATSSDLHASARASSSLVAELAAKEKTSDIKTSTTARATEPVLSVSPPPLPASPMPALPAAEIEAEVSETEVVLAFGDGGHARRYRVRGLAKAMSYEQLKVNVLVCRGEKLHVDTLDLYAAKQRASYVNAAALELQVTEDAIKTDLGRVLLKLEALQDERIKRALAPKSPEAVKMTEAEREAARVLLGDPRLLDRIVEDLEACGVVGERTNKLVGYLAATSRKLDAPLAVLVQSSSAAGKSTLMDAVLALMPEEERVKYSAMTGQALFYVGDGDLKHKILAIVEEEGAARAAYALKLLQSEGELTIASTGKDPATGNLVTQEYRVEGPTMLFTTTTAAEIDPELQNRCLVLGVDESREQTQAIHRLQRDKRTLEGFARKARRREVQALHRNAQRLLRPLEVLNPYAARLTFPDQATRMRRDHEKYLTLIDTIALVHQMQREVKTTLREQRAIEYVEATLEDIAVANALAHEVLGRSLDELPPQTRRLLQLIERHVAAECDRQRIVRAAYRFSRRVLREAVRWGDTQLRVHLERLVELEYVIAHRGGRGSLYEYELLYDGAGVDGKPFVPGLIDVEGLRATVTAPELAGVTLEFAGKTHDLAGALRPHRGPVAGGSRGEAIAEDARGLGLCGESAPENSKTHSKGGNGKDDSYIGAVPLAAASIPAARGE